jgi:biotin synthase
MFACAKGYSLLSMSTLRHDWTTAEILNLLNQPFIDLVYQAQTCHRQHWPGHDIQLATLLSVKTGGCAENCGYCAQSAHHPTAVQPEPFKTVDEVLTAAQKAKELGSDRFCMGWAWREIPEGKPFEAMLDMVRGVCQLGLETCVTAGMLTPTQAKRLAEAGLTAYNHNLDTSPEYYNNIVTTRTYSDRLETLAYVRQAGITVCCGGIIGMGEHSEDRARMLEILATLNPHPESVPINALMPMPGTPLAQKNTVDPLDLVRMCATARIVMPQARIRLSAGRHHLTPEAQALCFLAGVNSIFYGETLLTAENPEPDCDRQLLQKIGVQVSHPSIQASQNSPQPA